ncbi:WAP four-disulfide core domain protein 2 isoform 2-T2 [Hipposideros larvatus]
MPTCRAVLLVATFLLGLLLLDFPPATSTGAEKTGVCPELKEDLNCTQECSSDGECADNLKCCQAGCATVCHLPNGTGLEIAPTEIYDARIKGDNGFTQRAL